MFSAQEISNLNELESFIFEYIKANKKKVANMTIRDLANEVHVSTTSILRLCRKFECIGFAEFKIKLKIHIENEEKINRKDDKKIYLEFLEMIEKDEYRGKIVQAVKLIEEKENLWIMESDFANYIANYGALYFTKLGKISSCMDDPAIYKNYNFYDNSVTIVLSVSGEDEELIKKVKFLKEQDGNIISFTNSKDCTIARLSDINIAYYAQLKSKDGEIFSTQMPVIYLLEKIAQEYKKINKL